MKSKINFVLAAAIFWTSGTGLVLAAIDTPAGTPNKAVATPVAASAQWTAGEVRKVDTEQGRLTIKHEALLNLDMPGMTMVFRVLDDKLLQNLKQGDKIMFRAEKLDAGFTVVKLEQAK
ncbi:MAG: copper-binding protein [Polaromonas sp.]|uniref:copper-binding protein n=1 Tax=Polaromonas sp. TaxID=1869339 RepID=UPI002735D4AD|nr:copper-binding protein [Polaromonas sp.]MDP2818896.1 copper-binding protein [Polaromonas sp.]